MRLTDLIKALIDVLDETGDCDAYITTQNETKMYNTVLIHYVEPNQFLENPILRLEGVEENE